MPLFSIVMPTRNRANLLPYALQSAIEQTFDDYEIVVSNNNSADDTAQVVRRLANDRVRYVQSDRTLPMPESWEFALSHAQGEYATILSDDDAVSPTMLERVSKHVSDQSSKLVSWARYLYVMDDWYVEEDRNKLFISSVTGQTQKLESAAMLRQWFDGCTYYASAPMLFNAVCHRSVIDAVRKKIGKFFIGPSPDVGASMAMLSATSHFLFMDDVLSLAGSGKQSIGANTSYNRGSASETFISEFGNDSFSKGPFKGVTITTAVADTLLSAKEMLVEELADYEINWVSYFAGCRANLIDYQKVGVDTASEIEELRTLMLKQPASFKLKLWSTAARSHRMNAISRVRKLLRPGREKALQRLAPTQHVISGDEAGFKNILECAHKLDSIVSGIKDQTLSYNGNQC